MSPKPELHNSSRHHGVEELRGRPLLAMLGARLDAAVFNVCHLTSSGGRQWDRRSRESPLLRASAYEQPE